MKTLRAYSMVIVLVVIAVLFHLLTNGLIFTAMNLTNIILQNSYVVLLILGMLPVILTGNVDLSVGSVLAFVGAIAAILQVNYHCGVLVTLLVSLLVGILIGCWQGMWIAYFDIPAFLVTLSGELVFRGLTQVVLDGASIGPFSASSSNTYFVFTVWPSKNSLSPPKWPITAAVFADLIIAPVWLNAL